MFKKILSLVVIATLFSASNLIAQVTPDGILFQAIAKDANGNGAAGRNIYAKVNILKGTATGTSVYAESFKVVSTDEGIFTIVIGKGNRTSGVANLKAIQWNEALYFVNIQIAIEPTVPGIGWSADNNYVDMGTSQLWTVPYALFSSKATVADSAMSISTIVPGSKGGTGVNNDGKTITLGQNLTFKGIGDITITTTGVSNISLPTTGLLANTQYVTDRIGTDTVSLSNRINALVTGSSTALADSIKLVRAKMYNDSLALSTKIRLDSTVITAKLRNDSTAITFKLRGDSTAITTKLRSDSTDLTTILKAKILIDSNAIATKLRSDSTAITFKLRGDSTAITTKLRSDSTDLTTKLKAKILIDSNAITTKLRNDSTAITFKLRSDSTAITLKLRGDSTAITTKLRSDSSVLDSRINLKVNIADTASMLTRRFARDTASLSNRINLKVNIADTGAMLLPYAIRSNTIASIDAEKLRAEAQEILKVNIADTGAMLLPYAIRSNTESIISGKLNIVDTSSMLLPYAIRSNTITSINTKVNIADSSAMLSPYAIKSNTIASINAEKLRAEGQEILKVNIADTGAMLLPYAIRSNTVASINEKINIIDTSSMLSPYAIRSNTVTSINAKVNIADTANMLSPYAVLSNTVASINAEKTRATNAENARVKYSDTTSILSPYAIRSNTEASLNEKINIIDTSSMLSPYAIRSNTVTSINTKVNIADTANMLSPYAVLSNTVASINAEKTRAQTAENLRVKYLDTANMLLPYAIRSNTEASINEKVNIIDTSSMLSPYAIRSNTVTSINTKVNIADTANMLSPYAVLSNTVASINAEKTRAQTAENLRVKYADTSLMLTPYAKLVNTEASINAKVNILDTSSMLLPYAIRSNTIASINEKVNILDTANMLLPYAIRSNTEASINAEKTRAQTAENLRVKYADTLTMLSPYAIRSNTVASINEKVNIVDTSAMLSPYAIRSNTVASINAKVNILDTANMLLPYAIRSNTEASINAEKTRAQIAENARVKYLDTANMLLPYALRSNTVDFINEKVNILDTATMLLPYAIRSNTINSINAEKTRAINAEALKVNILDTANMLLPYAIRSNTIASINEKVNILDTSLMLSPYAIRSNTVASLNLKAALASPEFTGTPKAPTATTGTSTTQIATTAFVAASISNGATPDATTTSKGKLQLANDLGGTADLPTVTSVGGSTAANINSAEILANAATAANTNNKIVKRNASGDFSAGTITANLLGTSTNVTGIVAGANGGTGVDNTGKTITLGGNVNTGAAFTTTGTTGAGNAADITLKTAGATELTLPLTGTLATLTGVEALTNKTINGITPTSAANGFTLAGGTTSKTLTVNNNATVSGTNTGDQTISLTGDLSGSGTSTFSTTLANSGVTAGSYGSATTVPTITVDAKGRVTNVANTTISGVSPVGSAMGSGKIIVGDALGVASIVDMSGDVTIDNLGVTTIGNNKITTDKVFNSNITYSKIQNVSTGKILGRTSAGNGIVEEIATTGTGDVVRAISPTFTGAPQVLTAISTSNDGTIANTEFVKRAISNIDANAVDGIISGEKGGTGIANTGKTITLGGNFATSGANSLIFTTTGATNVSLPTSGTLATVAQLDAIQGGTFSGGQITGIVAPANGGTGIDNGIKTITLGGSLLTGAAFTTTGTTGAGNAAAITLKTTAATDLTLPTSGTLATLNGTETLTNKTITATANSISGLTNANLSGTAGITDANLATISTAGKIANTATTATNANTINAIVARDGSGNFIAGTITAALAGNAATATKLATPISIYGNNFDGTANLGQVITPAYGGTGNAFTKFTGATSSEKIYNLPDASATILTTNALITPAQGGTGVATAAMNTFFAGPISGSDAAPSFRALAASDLPAGNGSYIANSTSQQTNSNFNISGAGIAAGSLTAGSIIKKDGTSAQFLKADGTVDSRSFATLTGSESLTNKSINGVTPTAVTTGFTIAGGLTNNKILTVAADANVSGTNTGDVALSGQNYLSISNQTITANAVNLSGTNVTGTLAAARFPALTGDITNTVGEVATTISNNAITSTKIADNAVTSTKIADNAVASSKIVTAAVTLDKIAPISVQTLLGNKSNSAASAPGEITIGSGLALSTAGVLSASGSGGTVSNVSSLTLGTTGTDVSSTVANSSTTPVITLNIPSASATARGLVTTGAQTIAGVKTFNSDIIVSGVSVGVGPNSTLTTNTVLGKNALANSATSDLNTAIGYNVLTVNGATAFGNTGVGSEALKSNTSGQRNTGIGESAMKKNTTGSSNTAVGEFASSENSVGSDNTAVGIFALAANTGSKNTAIGSSANATSTTLENTTAIGYGSTVSASNTIQLGNTDIANVKTSGTITAGNVTYPKLDGSNGQVLVTNGSGVTTFKTMDGAGVNLADGKILVGNASNIATAVNVSGDITMTNGGVASIAAGAIVTADLAAAAVTYAKIQNMSTKTLIGNKSASAGVPGEITLGTGLALNETTGVLSASGSGGTVSGTGAVGQLPYWSSTTALGGNPNFTWDNTNKIAKIGEGVNHANVESANLSLSTMPVFSVIGKINDATEQTLLRLKRVHNHGSSYEGVFDFVSTGATTGNLARLDIRLNSPDNANSKNVLSLENLNGNVGINNTSPTEKLDVTGNLRFSGALKPNNLAGTAGQVLTSQGASTAPTWVTPSSGIGGSGTASYIPKFNASTTTLGNSKLFDDGTSVFVNSTDGSGGNKFVVNSGARTLPATSGTTQSGGAIRIGGSSNDVMDMGIGSLNGWIQVADKVSLATKYALLLNPNGGNVGIGVTSATSTLHVNGNVKANSFNDLIVKSNGTNVVLGQGNVLVNLTTGENNVAVGQYTLNYLDVGSANLGMGYSAMYNTRGSSNVGLGHEALWTNNTGNYNTAIGRSAGYSNTGSNNTFLGFEANSTGSLTNATAIGNGANVSTSNTIQLGNSAVTNVKTSGTITAGAITYPSVAGTNGYVLTTNGSNTATWVAAATGIGGSGTASYIPKFNGSTTTLGNSLIFDNGTSIGINTASPSSSFKLDVNGAANFTNDIVVNGMEIGLGNGAISSNIMLGNYEVGYANSTGSNLTAIGTGSFRYNSTGSNNVGVGYWALRNNSTGSRNVAIGDNSLTSNITGTNITAIGYGANSADGLTNATAIGNGANVSTSNTIQLGNSAVTNVKTNGMITASSITAPTINGASIKLGAGSISSNIVLGGNSNTFSGNSTGAENFIFGNNTAMDNTSGSYNIAMGTEAFRYNTTGSQSIGLGAYALRFNTTGNYNVAIGYNTAIANTTGSYLTAIGYGANSADGLTNATAIGNGANVSTSNTIQLGNSAVTNVKTSGTITAGAITYPSVAGTNGYVLTTNGSNTASWVAATTGIGGSGTASYIPKFNGSTTTLGNSLIFDDGTSVMVNTNTTALAGGAALLVSDGANAAPVTTGTTQTGGALRIRGGDNTVIDFGTVSTKPWIQAGDLAGLGTTYPLYLNPNGGTVAIGLGTASATSTSKLQVNGDVGATTFNSVGLKMNTNKSIVVGSGAPSVTGGNNISIGEGTLNSLTTAGENIAIGYRSMYKTNQEQNTAVGHLSMYENNGRYNTAIGFKSGYDNTTGENNTFLGYFATASIGNLTNATAIGNGAIVTASNTMQLGNTSVTSVKTSAAFNAPVYSSSPVALTAGTTITWAPMSGLNASVTLNANSTLSFGANAPPAGSSGTLIVTQPASGGPYTLALPASVTNKVLGSSSGITLSSAANARDIVSFYYDGSIYYWNVGLGYGSAQSLSASSLSGGVAGAIPYQTAINTTGFTAAGTAGQLLSSNGTSAPTWITPSFVDLSNAQTIGGNKTFTGTTTLSADGVINGLRIGRGAGNSDQNTAFGVSALGTGTGSRNTAIGTLALASYNGTGFNNNTSVGYSNLNTLTNGTGNTSVGAESMMALTTGSHNTSIGNQSLISTTGDNNTGVGKGSGSTLTTGSNNTLIGSTANVGVNNLTNATALGYGATVATSNTVQLGNSSVTSVVTSGAITAGAITYPNVAGTNGYVLTTNGSNTATWAAASGGITGSGTQNYLPKYNNAAGTTLGNSAISDDGTTVTINNPVSFNNKTIAGGSAAVNAQTGTTYSLVQGDNGRVITMNNASAITLTIPSGLTAGFNCMIVQYGAGTVTIAGSGVTVVNRSNYTKTGGQYAIVTIVSPVANTFITGGDMQ